MNDSTDSLKQARYAAFMSGIKKAREVHDDRKSLTAQAEPAESQEPREWVDEIAEDEEPVG